MGPNAEGGPAPDPPPETPFAARLATVADASTAGRLHASGIGQGFLSTLGPRFLTRLYARIVRQPGCFVLVVGQPGGAPDRIAGFVAGSTDVARLYRSFLWRDGVRAALPVAGRLIRSVPKVVETLRHGTGGDAGSGRGTELLAIAVEESQRGTGAGRELVSAFLDEVVACGGDSAHVVVAADNAAAVHLYRRCGFVEAARFELHAGTESLLLQWDQSPLCGDGA